MATTWQIRSLAVLAATLLFGTAMDGQDRSRQSVTRCWQDIVRFDGSSKAVTAPEGGGISLRLDSGKGQFFVSHDKKTFFTFAVGDLSSNPEALWSPDGHAFAINYSDGGAIGGFHVRVFSIRGDTVLDVSSAIQPAVADFKSRHYCKTRGNNVMALKWKDSNHLLLWTQVYPTGDCGSDLGHEEGYLVAIPDGKVEAHLTRNQLANYPGVCLENDDNH